jgi:hypothetical protein
VTILSPIEFTGLILMLLLKSFELEEQQ